VDEEQSRLHFIGARLPIDDEADFSFHEEYGVRLSKWKKEWKQGKPGNFPIPARRPETFLRSNVSACFTD
jgi:hypothetical protein